MDEITRYRALAAFCRQRARMVGENEQFWLTQADGWATRSSSESGETLRKKKIALGAKGRKALDPSQNPPA